MDPAHSVQLSFIQVLPSIQLFKESMNFDYVCKTNNS